MPAPPQPSPAEEETLDEGSISAAELLENGFAFWKTGNAVEASEAFNAAIETGSLNDAGRAVAYWHIFLADQRRGDLEAGGDALASFLVAAQEVFDGQEDLPVGSPNADFAERFDLESRMARARAILSAMWAQKVPAYGRTAEHPVLIHSDEEMGYFLELAPPCAETDDKQVSRRNPVRKNQVTTQRITVRCTRASPELDYYFQPNSEE